MIIVNESEDRLTVRSSAKVNLFLEVKGARSDGYHEIETVFQEVAIHDELDFERLPPGQGASRVDFNCDIPGLAPPGANLVEKAASAYFREAGIDGAVRIRLRKNVPSAAGLGGGSANAVATLLALQRLFRLRLTLNKMLRLAATLGSDCPFFVQGGSAIGRGRGDQLEPIELPRKIFFIAVPHIPCATSAIYASLARRRSASLNAPRDGSRILDVKTLRELDRDRFESGIFNRLEIVAFEQFPLLHKFASQLIQICKVPFHLTGSGSGLFTVCNRLEDAKLLHAACQDNAGTLSAAAHVEHSPHPTTVRTFVAESLELRPY